MRPTTIGPHRAGHRAPVEPPRSTRLAMRLPIFCKGQHGDSWRAGVTVNVSRTGILFQIPGGRVPHGQVDLLLRSFAGPAADSLPEIRCVGRVVRVAPSTSGVLDVAVTLDDHGGA